MSAEEVLAQIAKEVSVCKKCALYHSRNKAVPGEGPADAEIMFIGEGPGFNENEQGRPFVGAAGNFLNELLAEAGLKRSDVWIGNVVKCRPPNNRGQMRRVGERYVIAMFHPAAALHQAALKPAILKDFGQLPKLLEQARAALKHSAPAPVTEDPKEDPKQLSLF